MKKFNTPQMLFAALFLAFGVILPSMFHSIGLAGNIFLPMHFPVLLCGLICGWKYGMIVGAIIPILSGVLTGMPPLYPVAIYMAVELAIYGIVTGIVSKRYNNLISIVCAMVIGRVALGFTQVLLIGGTGALTFQIFIAGSVFTAFPGILLQLITIPSIMLVLKKSHVLDIVCD